VEVTVTAKRSSNLLAHKTCCYSQVGAIHCMTVLWVHCAACR